MTCVPGPVASGNSAVGAIEHMSFPIPSHSFIKVMLLIRIILALSTSDCAGRSCQKESPVLREPSRQGAA
jgi:hypothetical protein